jgi:chemotaxis protein MotB
MADSGNPNPAPIIIVRKNRKGHGGHYGGAWKVAYADFVTALMALFIVLWIVNTSQTVRDAVSGYFKDPRGYGKDKGTTMTGKAKEPPKQTVEVSKETMNDLKKKLEDAMKRIPELEKLKNQVEMTITSDGLRIELLETDKGVFFESGSPHPTKFGQELMELLAAEIGKLPNHVLVEGHTDSRPYISQTGYSNWELSADRANSARRIMQTTGLRTEQVSEVRGYADQKLRKPKNPNDASNRRISVTVKYPEAAPPSEPKAPSPVSTAPPQPPAPKKH